jgi:VanZ family protein
VNARRLPAVLLLLYLLFLAYGSFFPFHFRHDPDAFARFLAHPIPRRLSLPDVAANVLLGVPFGVLMVWVRWAGASLLGGLARVAVLDALLAAAVEAGQLYVPGRLSSAADVVAQTVGSAAGFLAARALLAGARDALAPGLVRGFRRRPALVLLAVLVAALAADALYPYVPTFDVSTVWQNLKTGQWRLFGGLGRAFWPDLLVEKVAAYAAVGVLLRVALEAWPPVPAAALAWGGAVALAAGLEGAKILIVGRSPNVDTVWLAALGALAGVTLAPAVGRWPLVRRHGAVLLVALAAGLVVYEELSPFSFVGSLAAGRARLPRIEWIPFAAYYGADFQSALFDFGKKLLLGGALGAAMQGAWARPRLVLVAVLAATLEALQIFQPTHIASTTDVLLLWAGALAGAHLLAWSQPPS